MNQLLDIFIKDTWGIVIVSTSIILLFGIGEYLRRIKKFDGEGTRKLSHFGAGIIIMAFPWLFQSHWTVALLSCNFFLILLIGKYTGLLSSVHDVERRTGGAYYYPLAVYSTFWLSKGDAILFCLPMSILAVADAGAALVGKRIGKRKYTVYDGKRSFEGSLTFFVLALTLSIAMLGVSGHPGWPEMLLVALAIAIFTTSLESISILGIDNLMIPYGAFLVLDRSLRIGLQDLSGWFEGMFLSTLIIAFTWKKAGLTEAGAMSIFVAGSLAWAIGDWYWTIPLVSLYAMFLLTIFVAGYQPTIGDTDLQDVFPTMFGALLIILLYSHFQEESLFIPYLTALAAGGALAMARLATFQRLLVLPTVFVGAIAPVLPLLLLKEKIPFLTMTFSIGIGLLCFLVLRKTTFLGKRLLATLLASALAWSLGGV
jgi:phytol kinase